MKSVFTNELGKIDSDAESLTNDQLEFQSKILAWKQSFREKVQYHGSKDDLDWRIDFKYLNFICFIKCLRSILIKSCSIE